VPPLRGSDRIIGIDRITLILQVWYSIGEHDKTPAEEDYDDSASSISTCIVDHLDLLGE